MPVPGIPSVLLMPLRARPSQWAPRTPTLRLGPERERLTVRPGEDAAAAIEAQAPSLFGGEGTDERRQKSPTRGGKAL